MKKPVLALMAHKQMTYLMVRMAKENEDKLCYFSLVATGEIGRLIEQTTCLEVDLVESGPMLGSLVASGIASAVIFLRDPLYNQPGEAELNAMLRICDTKNVPVATNVASARAVLQFIMTLESSIEEVLSNIGTRGIPA